MSTWVVTHCNCEPHGLCWTVPGLACARRINTRAPGPTSTSPLFLCVLCPCAFGFEEDFLNAEGFLTLLPISRASALAVLSLNKQIPPPEWTKSPWTTTYQRVHLQSRNTIICFQAPRTLLISAMQWMVKCICLTLSFSPMLENTIPIIIITIIIITIITVKIIIITSIIIITNEMHFKSTFVYFPNTQTLKSIGGLLPFAFAALSTISLWFFLRFFVTKYDKIFRDKKRVVHYCTLSLSDIWVMR